MRRFSGGKPPKNALTFVTILIGLQAAHATSWTGNPESREFRTVAVEPPENIIHAVPGTETTMAANKDFLPMDPVVEYCGSIVEVSKSCSCDHHKNKKQICLTNFSRTFEHLRQNVKKKPFRKGSAIFQRKHLHPALWAGTSEKVTALTNPPMASMGQISSWVEETPREDHQLQ